MFVRFFFWAFTGGRALFVKKPVKARWRRKRGMGDDALFCWRVLDVHVARDLMMTLVSVGVKGRCVSIRWLSVWAMNGDVEAAYGGGEEEMQWRGLYVWCGGGRGAAWRR